MHRTTLTGTAEYMAFTLHGGAQPWNLRDQRFILFHISNAGAATSAWGNDIMCTARQASNRVG